MHVHVDSKPTQNNTPDFKMLPSIWDKVFVHIYV